MLSVNHDRPFALRAPRRLARAGALRLALLPLALGAAMCSPDRDPRPAADATLDALDAHDTHTSDAATQDAPAPDCTPLPHTDAIDWRPAFDASALGAFLSVWGSGACDLWIAGGQPDTGALLHGDGQAWSPVDLPEGVPLLNWVHGTGPDDVWIVGNRGLSLRGSRAAGFARVDTPTDADLWGVWAASPDEAWAVGGKIEDPDGTPVLLHFHDGAWHLVSLPASDRPARALFKIWGLDGRPLLAVGQYGLVLRPDGDAWVEVPSGTGQDLISLWGTDANNLSVIGGRSNATLGRWDAATFTPHDLPGLPGMNGIFVAPDGVATLVGTRGAIARLQPDQTFTRETSGTRDVLHATWTSPSDARFAVGGSLDLPPPWTGTVLIDP